MFLRSFSLFCLVSATLFGGSVTLVNDSKFPLIAEVYGSQGQKLFSIKLSVGQTYMWYEDNTPFKSGGSNLITTPYTVRFLCNVARPYDYTTQNATKDQKDKQKPPKYQTEYGSWEMVPTGAMVNALSCTSGSKTCVVKKKADQESKDKSPPSRTQKSQPNKDPFIDWSNDGDQGFENDGGPPWDNNGAP